MEEPSSTRSADRHFNSHGGRRSGSADSSAGRHAIENVLVGNRYMKPSNRIGLSASGDLTFSGFNIISPPSPFVIS